jgi:hypothetical protein
MLRDMTVRGFSPRTHEAYVQHVVGLARYHRRAPDQLTADEVQVYLGGEATLPPLPPRSPTACAPSPCPPGPTSARRIPAGAAGTARQRDPVRERIRRLEAELAQKRHLREPSRPDHRGRAVRWPIALLIMRAFSSSPWITEFDCARTPPGASASAASPRSGARRARNRSRCFAAIARPSPALPRHTPGPRAVPDSPRLDSRDDPTQPAQVGKAFQGPPPCPRPSQAPMQPDGEPHLPPPESIRAFGPTLELEEQVRPLIPRSWQDGPGAVVVDVR